MKPTREQLLPPIINLPNTPLCRELASPLNRWNWAKHFQCGAVIFEPEQLFICAAWAKLPPRKLSNLVGDETTLSRSVRPTEQGWRGVEEFWNIEAREEIEYDVYDVDACAAELVAHYSKEAAVANHT